MVLSMSYQVAYTMSGKIIFQVFQFGFALTDLTRWCIAPPRSQKAIIALTIPKVDVHYTSSYP